MNQRSLNKCHQGFTLIEVLVALSIIAISLGSGAKAIASLSEWTERQHLQGLASLCTENQLIAWRLQKQIPALGSSESTCEQAQYTFHIQTHTQPTPNPNFVRTEVTVVYHKPNTTQILPLLSMLSIQSRF